MPKLPRDVGCEAEGCGGRTYARSLCQKHYNAARYRPRFSPGRISCRRSVAENIAACTARDTETGCLNWTGGLDEWGYGRYGKSRRAHRVAFEDAKGPIPGGLLVCHQCDNPRCVEPAHLFLGTNEDNTADRVAKGRCAFAKLNIDQVRAIRNETRNHSEIARAYSLSLTTVRRIRAGKSWRFAA